MMTGIGDIKKHKCLVSGLMFGTLMFIMMSNIPKREDRLFLDVDDWAEDRFSVCGGNFTGFGHEFARLRNAVIDSTSPERFGIDCGNEILPSYEFMYGKEGSHLVDWMSSLRNNNGVSLESSGKVHTRPTIAVRRYEAHNIYHTMTDWYNVFLVCQLLNLDASSVDILLVDDRPSSLMDSTWGVLFGTVYTVKDLHGTVVFRDLIWNVLGYESPLNFHMLLTLPYADDFYRFFIEAFHVRDEKGLDCDRLNVTIIWRRDYLSHPERRETSSGLIHRKFRNEKEILAEVKDTLRGQGEGHSVSGVVLEDMTMESQIVTFSRTDILIGMHGAGMSHVMFLPPHAAVFETFPNYWGYLPHFRAFSRWRKLKYRSWRNEDQVNEFPYFCTYIPPEVIRRYVTEVYDLICHE